MTKINLNYIKLEFLPDREKFNLSFKEKCVRCVVEVTALFRYSCESPIYKTGENTHPLDITVNEVKVLP